MALEIKRYTTADKQIWDEFVENSVNGTFLFKRDYMEYHADRFLDHSLMFFKSTTNCEQSAAKLCAILPANEVVDNEGRKHLHSHQGLTYGGLILSEREGTNDVMQMFDDLKAYMQENGFSYLHYKQMPTVYHHIPAQEDEYALWRNNATIEVCNISSALLLEHSPKLTKGRHWGYCSARKQRLSINYDASLADFWPILEDGLKKRYDTAPVHTLAEIEDLKSKFPHNIKCITITNESNEVLGGIVLFTCGICTHLQYAISTEVGQSMHAMDLLYIEMLKKLAAEGKTRYFDFGTSNEEKGRYLNSNLISFKESLGGRGIAYKQWLLTL